MSVPPKPSVKPSIATRLAHLSHPLQSGDVEIRRPQADAVALYERYSTAAQGEKSESRQDGRARLLAEKLGSPVYKVYVDRGRTGTTLHRRTAIHDLLTDAAAGLFDKVIIESVDRLARDMASHRFVFKRLVILGIRLLEANGEVIDDITLMFKGLLSVEERRVLLERTYAGRKNAVKSAIIPHKIRFGYIPHPTKIGARLPHPEFGNVIRSIFNDFDDGISRSEIAKALTGSCPTPQDCRDIAACRVDPQTRSAWTCDMITDILTCYTYKGFILDCTTKVQRDPVTNLVTGYVARPPDEWARAVVPEVALVDPILWDRCYLRVQQMREHSVRAESATSYLFTGRLVCGRCGEAMTSYAQKGVRRYKCSRKVVTGCSGVGRPSVADVERNVLEMLEELVSDAGFERQYEEAYRAAEAAFSSQSETGRIRLQDELARIDEQIPWVKAHAAGFGFSEQRIAAVEDALIKRRDAMSRSLSILPQGSKSIGGKALVSLAAGFRRMREALPFRGAVGLSDETTGARQTERCMHDAQPNCQSRKLVRSVRSLVTKVSISPGEADGPTTIMVHLSLRRAKAATDDGSGFLTIDRPFVRIHSTQVE